MYDVSTIYIMYIIINHAYWYEPFKTNQENIVEIGHDFDMYVRNKMAPWSFL